MNYKTLTAVAIGIAIGYLAGMYACERRWTDVDGEVIREKL